MNKSQATSRMTIFVTSTICFIICLFVSLFGVFGIILSTMHSKARGHSIKEFFFFFFFLFSYASNITSIYYRLTRAFLATPLPPPLSISPPLRTCSLIVAASDSIHAKFLCRSACNFSLFAVCSAN